jgi:hypothetical protein
MLPAEAHRHAYNTAFQELDLNWSWDPATCARVLAAGPAGLRAWVQQEQAHLLHAYDVDFLVDAIERVKAACLERIAAAVAQPRLAA